MRKRYLSLSAPLNIFLCPGNHKQRKEPIGMNAINAPLTVNWKKNLFFVWISQFLAMIGFGCCMPFIPLYLREHFHIVDNQLRGFYVSLFYLTELFQFPQMLF